MNRLIVLVVIAGIAAAAGCSKKPDASPATAALPAASGQAAAPGAPAAVAESVAEVPDYPGALRVALSQRADTEHGSARTSEASWTSADPFATVVAHYQKVIAERGWTVTEAKSKATEAEWKLAKGTSTGKIEVKQGPGTQVTIKVERSDR